MKRFLIAIPLTLVLLFGSACNQSQNNTDNALSAKENNEYSNIADGLSQEDLKEYNITADTSINAVYEYSNKSTGIMLDMLGSLANGEIDGEFFISSLNDINTTTTELKKTLDSTEALASPSQYTENYISSVRQYADISIEINNELLSYFDDNDNDHIQAVTEKFNTIKGLNETTIPNARIQYLKSIGCSDSEIETIISSSETTN